MVQTGYILLADISGYTRFLEATELDHAQGVLHDLLAAMIADLRVPLTLSSVRGDAIVAHAPATNLPDGVHLVEAVESLYLAFRTVLLHMERNTTCPCAACRAIPGLELKMIVHFGEYVVQRLAGRPELHGADVVAAFRLLKNDIIDATGIKAYVGYTEAATTALAVPAYFASLPLHAQETEEFGEIPLRVADMAPVWGLHQEATRVRVAPDAPRFFEDVVQPFSAPAEHVWTLASDPAARHRWFPSVVKAEVDDARRGVGATVHCAHTGGPPTIYTIVDCRPFDYITFDVRLPMGGHLRVMMALETEEGVRMRVAVQRADAGNVFARTLLRVLTRSQAKAQRQAWVAGLAALSALADEVCGEHIEVAAATPTVDDLRASAREALTA